MTGQNILLKTGRCFLFFAAGVFVFSSIFLCHIPSSQAASLEESPKISHNHINDSHHSSGLCHIIKKQSLVNQNEAPIFLTNSQFQNPNQQKFFLTVNSEIPENSTRLAKQRDGPFVSLENLLISQTSQLLTVFKLE